MENFPYVTVWIVTSLHLKCHITELRLPFNNLLASSDFGHMLLVGTIRFEVRFCASRKGGPGG